MKKNRINFLRRTQLLQSATLICVILMIISLVRVSALLPGVSKEADKKKSQAKAKIYEKEYVRGSILDRNGNTIAFSQKPGGARTYSHPYAFSNLVGYWSKIYGTYGVEKTMNEELVHSNCGANPKQKKGADVSLTIDAALQERAYKDIEKYKGSVAVLDAKTGELLDIAVQSAQKLLDEVKLSEPEDFFFSTLDGESHVHGFVMMPHDAKKGEKYPAILYIHGGPHPFYTYGLTMEFQMLAAKGFAVLYCNPRGSSVLL